MNRNYLKFLSLALVVSSASAETTKPSTTDSQSEQAEKSVEKKSSSQEQTLRNLEVKQQQLEADVEELKNRKFLILFVDQNKIRELLLKKRIQKRREFSAEAQEKISNLEFERSSLIVRITAENFEEIRQEFSNKERQLKVLREETDNKLREMSDEEDEIFDQCLRQAISQYYTIHESEMKDGTALINISALITNMQSLEPNSSFIVRDCTQEITNLSLSYFLKLDKASSN
jgi:hypothetical protein